MFRLTMDYRPINTATVNTAWTMQHIDAVLIDVQGAKTFVKIAFAVATGSYDFKRKARTYTPLWQRTVLLNQLVPIKEDGLGA